MSIIWYNYQLRKIIWVLYLFFVSGFDSFPFDIWTLQYDLGFHPLAPLGMTILIFVASSHLARANEFASEMGMLIKWECVYFHCWRDDEDIGQDVGMQLLQ